MAPDTKVEVDYALTSMLPLQARVFGADQGSGFKSAFYINGSGNMSFGMGETFAPWSTGITTNLFRHRAVLDVQNITAYYITRFATNWSGHVSAAYGLCETNITTTATHPLALFGNPNSTAGLTFVGSHHCKVKIYGFKCWKAGVLVHDYVPCVKGGVPGFKDNVDGAFVTAENPAALQAGGKGLTVETDDGYISSYGNNVKGFRYIDTGYTASANTRVELDYAFADNYPAGSGDWFLFEAAGNYRLSVYANANQMGWCGGGTNWRNWNIKPAAQTTQKGVRRTAIVDNKGADGKTWSGLVTAGFTNCYASANPSTSATYNTKTLRLAVSKDGGGYAPIKVYGLKIYESGTLVRNYVPYAKDGMAGLRDTETGGFVTASGRVAFTAGGDIASNSRDDAYLESDRTQGINTGYLMKGAQSRVECDFAFTDCTTNSTGTTGYQQRVFGTDTNGDLKYALYINGSGNFMYGFGNTFINNHGPGTAADTKRYTAVIDGYHDRLYWIIDGVTNKTYDISADAHGNTTDVPMGIFATPNQAAATTWRNGSKMKLYSMRIYEQDVLKHEYIPYKKGTTVGLYDTVDGIVKTDARNSAAPFKIGGKGVDGAEKWIVLPQGAVLREGDAPRVISANASGAQSYKWTKDGEAIEGGEDGEMTVSWNRKGGSAIYAVTPVYDLYGTSVEGEPVAVTVTSVPLGMAIIVR